MQTFTVKAILPNAEEVFYKSVNEQEQGEKAVNINFCNVTGSAVKVSLSFTPSTASFLNGAIIFEKEIAANENLVIEPRWINSDNEIRAYADTIDAVVMSIDIENVFGENIYPTV